VSSFNSFHPDPFRTILLTLAVLRSLGPLVSPRAAALQSFRCLVAKEFLRAARLPAQAIGDPMAHGAGG